MRVFRIQDVAEGALERVHVAAAAAITDPVAASLATPQGRKVEVKDVLHVLKAAFPVLRISGHDNEIMGAPSDPLLPGEDSSSVLPSRPP